MTKVETSLLEVKTQQTVSLSSPKSETVLHSPHCHSSAWAELRLLQQLQVRKGDVPLGPPKPSGGKVLRCSSPYPEYAKASQVCLDFLFGPCDSETNAH